MQLFIYWNLYDVKQFTYKFIQVMFIYMVEASYGIEMKFFRNSKLELFWIPAKKLNFKNYTCHYFSFLTACSKKEWCAKAEEWPLKLVVSHIKKS